MKHLLQDLIVKGSPVRFYLMNSADDPHDFYGEMGHVFASADIRKELDGYPINNDNDRYWIVAFNKKGKLVGFRAFGNSDEKGYFYDTWIDEQFRGTGIYRVMFDHAESELVDRGVKTISVIGNEKARPILEKFGFVVDRMRGRFAYMHKEIE